MSADAKKSENDTAASTAAKPTNVVSAAGEISTMAVPRLATTFMEIPLRMSVCCTPISAEWAVTAYQLINITEGTNRRELCLCRVYSSVTDKDTLLALVLQYEIVDEKNADKNKVKIEPVREVSDFQGAIAGDAL